MNTRTPIQPSTFPAVLSVSFSSATGSRFIAGLSDGLQCFRTDNCLTTYHPSLPQEGGYAIAEALDDRYIALVGGGRAPATNPSVVAFWDAKLGVEASSLDLREPVLAVRAGSRWMIAVLRERCVMFEYQVLEPRGLPTPPPQTGDDDVDGEEILRGPNKPTALYPTATNPFALAALKGELLALPAVTVGQVQIIPLHGGSKRVLRAHNSSLRQLALSHDGALLATASEQGTLIRVFSTKTTDQLFDFRRGVDKAVVLSLAFSPGNRWLASTSDKGTLHIFDLRPPDPATLAAEQSLRAREKQAQHKKSQSYAGHRLSGGENTSSLSGGRSSPASITPSAAQTGTAYQGSVQEYYGLRPVPSSASPPTTGPGISAMAAFKSSSWAPKVFKDVRSVASAPFHMGDDPPYWQGGGGHSWTTGPNGKKKWVRNPITPLPAEPTGRPPKGVMCVKVREGDAGHGGDDDGAVVYVIGGGSDARWEMFELLPAEGGGWGLVCRGFRQYLTRQFVD